MDKPAACFTIHSLTHLRAALTAGALSGLPVVALSAAGASGFAGAAWFVALTLQGRGEFPDVALTAILDCGDRAGDVPAAVKRGITHIVFAGHPEAAARLQDIAGQMGATLLTERPETCDLLTAKDPFRAARIHCETLGK